MHGLQEGHRDQNRPGNLHQKEKALHRDVWCFFVNAERVRVWLTRESAVHGMQEVTVIRIGPVISTNKDQRGKYAGFCFTR